ncbi:MAG: phage scaffolding protein [Eubacteriales bacterium]|nr:phage scaffolding protein [Eubacteriales bacterium]
MKREELEKLGLTKEQIDSVMAINGTDVEANKKTLATKDEQIAALTTERDGLKTQVSDRDKDIAELKKSAGSNEALTQQLADLQTKYDTETSTLKKTLETQAIDHAAESLFSGFEFTSALAKKAALHEFLAQNPEFKDGKFTDADGRIKKLRETYPDAFKPEKKAEPEQEPGAPKPPQFTHPMNNPAPQGGKNPFDFHFTPVRSSGAAGDKGGK